MRQPALRRPRRGVDRVASRTSTAAAAAGDHRELGIESFEVELADDALMTLLDEEPAGAGLELLLDELELALGEPEAAAIVLARSHPRSERRSWSGSAR